MGWLCFSLDGKILDLGWMMNFGRRIHSLRFPYLQQLCTFKWDLLVLYQNYLKMVARLNLILFCRARIKLSYSEFKIRKCRLLKDCHTK